ncbi:acyltransferase [Cohnella lupini]|uniref:Surface polysaccharide O-acyltransferase-like enzyme n=1 Tax=Cohnella lupini TaxID=1294267 RepID=A0A3D9I789_9BACL|nr:acyltransferase [Cohnella lupini]RED57612.1 surface polysaccharide O-acyltransferase-like enzyme [Cohnella lupini]
MERRAKLTEIDIVRGIAILGVLMVHSTSFATVDMKETSLYGVYNFLNIFSKIGTTSFILLSSFVLFYNYYPQPLTVQRFKKFYRNRLLYIVVPYMIFSTIYFALRWYQNGFAWELSRMWPSYWDKILHGQAYTHLYFVFISIQLYLMFPILLYLFKRFRWLAATAVIVGVGLQWAFFLYNREYWQVTNRGSWSPTYFGQYFLGAWLGIYFDKIKAWLIIAKDTITKTKIVLWIALWSAWLASGIAYVRIFYNQRMYQTVYHNALYDGLWDIYTMLTPLVLIQIAFLIGGRMNSSFWVGRLRHLGVVSFGVYLFHPLILLVYRKFPLDGGGTMVYHAWYAGGFLCALLISWVVVTLISRMTGWSWLLFGSVPAQLEAAVPRKPSKEAPVSSPSASA